MTVNVSEFRLINVVDTCSIWNILSCRQIYSVAKQVNCSFSITEFVEYECLFKPRKNPSPAEINLQNILRQKLSTKEIGVFPISIDDLQSIDVGDKRMRLGRGELSSIAFAKKISQSVLTDDQKARNLGEAILSREYVQTTPHLVGWLIFEGHISSASIEEIVLEHEQNGGPLGPFFRKACLMALQWRLQSR